MNNGTRMLNGRRVVGALAVCFVAACSLVLHAGEPGNTLQQGSVKLVPGLPAGADIPIAPATHAVPIDTAVANEAPRNPGTVGAAGGVCDEDLDCDDCSTCTIDECIFTPPSFFGVCQHTPRDLCELCGDDTFCNGVELCDDAAGCQLATLRPCDTDPTKICDENEARAGNDPCVLPCGSGGVAVADDGMACNGTEVCNLIECVGGDNAGAPCSDDTPCTGAGGFCGGVVIHVNPPCGSSTASCTEGTPVTCGTFGRCCTPNPADPSGTGFTCGRATKDQCTSGGGTWLQVGDVPGTPGDEATCTDRAPASASNAGEGFSCPAYGAGIAPGGPFPEILGKTGFAACATLSDLGDDYAIPDSGPGGANEFKFIRLNTIRWVGGFQQINIQGSASRYRVVIYDQQLNRIEDVITDPVGQGDAARRTVIFEERPFIPARGFIVIEPAPRFSPFARQFWATTSSVDVGTNDPNTMWVNGGPADAQTAFPGTTGQLAFEIVGDIVDSPEGACCNANTGECGLTLPWLCNGSFQGAGVQCQVCANNPFTACVTNADCPACASNGAACDPNADCPQAVCSGGFCDGGPNVGNACDVNVDCPAGDTCSATDTCVPVPPACSLSACCVTDPAAGIKFCVGGEKADVVCTTDADCALGGTCTGVTSAAGDCVTVIGASCLISGSPCTSDSDCLGGVGDTCEAPCPTGSVSSGFGSSCDPQLCIQPPSGFDTCAEASLPANLKTITVPAIGAPPVTVTFSGDNSAATFNDHQDDVGAASATCNTGIFSSQGANKDRGWWHSFSIDDCAVVRVDFCGTFENYGDIRQPQWANLWAQCDPCGTTIPASIVGSPVGTADASGNRGLPFCTGGDDLWESYGPLQPGVYWVPVFTAPGGYIGPYQMHVTVSACPTAACCLPGSFCVDPGTQFLILDGANNPISCATTACAVGSCETCALARQPDCDSIGGFWNGLENLPSGSAPFVTSCNFGGDSVCDIGSCCQGAGNCQDTFGDPALCDPTADPPDPDCCDPQVPTTCMNRGLCDTISQGSGSFVGGAKCDFPTPPCPACAILGANNCQLPASDVDFGGASASISDLTVPPNGTVAADDFIPSGTTLTSVCVWGFYHDASVDMFGCVNAVDDEFRVRVYADAGGAPGALLGESMVTGANISRGKEPGTAFEALYGGTGGTSNATVFGYTLKLDTPITTMQAGVTNWLEVANNTTGSTDAAKTCWWNWLNSYPTDAAEDGYSVGGANSGGTENPADYLLAPSRYINGGGRPYDMAFCMGMGPAGDVPLSITPVTSLKAACWTCPAAGTPTCTVETKLACMDNTGIQGIWNRDDPTCSGTFADVDGIVADSCTGAAAASVSSRLASCGDGLIDPGEQCDPPGPVCDTNCQLICPGAPLPGTCSGGMNAGEPCTTVADCPDPTGACDLPAGGAVTITAGLHLLDTNCGGTDGSTSVGVVGGGNANVGNDSWYFYKTTCTGRMTVSACPTQNGLTEDGFNVTDNLVALYHDPNAVRVCFGGTNAQESCTTIADCPDPTGACEEADFLCPGASTQFQDGLASDEGCNGIGDAGSGILGRLVLPGEKWTIRVTNFGSTSATAAGGPMIVDVDCIASACFPSQAPTIQQIPDSGGTLRDNKKGRFLPVQVTDVGRMSAIQVEFIDLPAPYDIWNGTKMFAQAPIDVCETSTVAGGACAVNTYTTAKLECTASPFTTDWNALGVINLWHEGIVPGGTYDVRVIDAECNPTLAASFSPPTRMQTAKFGDTVGTGGFQFPVDNNPVGVDDALAGIATFSNAAGKPSKSRTELASACIDNKANIDDVLMSLSGFSGGKHPQSPSTPDACNASCPNP